MLAPSSFKGQLVQKVFYFKFCCLICSLLNDCHMQTLPLLPSLQPSQFLLLAEICGALFFLFWDGMVFFHIYCVWY